MSVRLAFIALWWVGDNRGESIRQVKIVPAENVRPVSESLAASDWSVVIISTLPFSLTGSRGRVS